MKFSKNDSHEQYLLAKHQNWIIFDGQECRVEPLFQVKTAPSKLLKLQTCGWCRWKALININNFAILHKSIGPIGFKLLQKQILALCTFII